MVGGAVPVNDGTLKLPCASERPLPSNSMQERSPLSRTMVENDVVTSADTISSAMEITRSHMMPSSTGS